ncbi:hypothetical protein HOP50_02g15570 [Chloropicon primus]|uniref:Uncharacterized protein n=1 Tax=Chloropicon primus TaxID=1764295 RepID=A0A5B8MEK2_9CHLO|nr:hypothetical protein A3770_02p15660 [Chloropicon primus]UPQ98257.1 hypothetical protein HOP50_02g15570 [Chloropicon primus]|mmetsp:Transcript_13692/g.38570  ORF Transcript_13692/g.38570 Transcript_13692/m.38570 type:complete len:151 (+) Transcript_13692:252-704(+)|eukprot:QDZ19048.1 hypothetical protein A3770_02p15660 [Chloropicon primus]
MATTFQNPMGQEEEEEGGLSRSYTRSSKHELLKQIRDAVNPNQRRQNVLLMAQAGFLSIAVILLAVFALLALVEIQKLTAATDTIIPNLDAIILGLTDIEKGVDAAYEATTLMPLLLTMNELSGYIEGNLTITVNAMVNSPVLTGGLLGR